MPDDDVVKALIEKSLEELSSTPKPIQKSRTWESPTAYKYLVQWSNTVLLRYFVRLFTSSLPKSEYRRKAQLDDAARSVVRNIEEGWKRANTSDYLNFIGYSQGSLEEVKGDIRELTEDKFLPSKPGSSLKGIGIDLGDFNTALKPKKLKDNKGDYRNVEENKSPSYTPIDVLYPPLKKVVAEDLTCEIFIELINKTDFLLRKLVESLELKLSQDQKGYKVGQAKIRDAFTKR
jgi:four helix bundle protein